METLIDMADKYNGFYCVWLGHKLKYFITRPEHVDILLNHPNAIGKEEIYELFECAVGQGLVTARGEKLCGKKEKLYRISSIQNIIRF